MDEMKGEIEAENFLLLALADTERLAAKKATIYSKLLTDMRLAENMGALAIRHEHRAERLEKKATGRVKNEEL